VIEARSDDELLAAVLQRDSDALMILYHRYNSRVFALAFRILAERQAAEEVSQDVFYRLWSRTDRYDSEKGLLLSWILTVTRNLALDYRRRESRRSERVVMNSESFVLAELRHSAQQVLPEPETSHALAGALEGLPKAQRVAVELAFFDGLTHEELAAKLGESLGTVKTRVRLGLQKMRLALLGVKKLA
jgi:RNA polymerase sigma-70 factor, ECF subfamily